MTVENCSLEIQSRKNKLLSGKTSHDQHILYAYQKYTVKVHNVILIKFVFKIKDRFTENEKLYKHFSCLSPYNFIDITNHSLPNRAFNKLC